MKKTLSDLNKLQGVMGSILVGRDGMLIASDLKVEVNKDAIGAVASSVLASLGRALDRMKLGDFKRYIISGQNARIAMYRAGPAILMILLEKEANMGLITIEIRDAIASIEEKIVL